MPKYPTEFVIRMESREGLRFNLTYSGLMLSFIPIANQRLHLYHDDSLVFCPQIIKVLIHPYHDILGLESNEIEQAKMERVNCVMVEEYSTNDALIKKAARWVSQDPPHRREWLVEMPDLEIAERRVAERNINNKIDQEIKIQKEKEKKERLEKRAQK